MMKEARLTSAAATTTTYEQSPGSPSFRYYFQDPVTEPLPRSDSVVDEKPKDPEKCILKKDPEKCCKREESSASSCEGSACQWRLKDKEKGHKASNWRTWNKGNSAVYNFLVSLNCYNSKNLPPPHDSPLHRRVAPQPLSQKD